MLQSLQNQQPLVPSAFRVEIKKRFGTLTTSACRLQVSVGGDRFEGEKLEALAAFCRRRYDSVSVIVSDTLQRHNRPSPDLAWLSTRKEGDEWLARNRATLEGFQIVRWDDLILTEEYNRQRSHIGKLVKTPAATEALELLSMNFNFRRGVPLENCRMFLLEEVSVFAAMFKDPAVDIYPGSWISSLLAAIPHESFAPHKVRCLSVEPVRRIA